MDLSKAIDYRLANLNNAALMDGQRVLHGSTVEKADFSVVPGVGYQEKRAEGDGSWASDVYLGPRQVALQGMLYAETQADLFDMLRKHRVAFSPTAALAEDPVNFGFLPLTYTQPTTDGVSFPGGIINLALYCRPTSGLVFDITRDRLPGTNTTRPQALPWRATLYCKDPRVYIVPEQQFPVQKTSGTTMVAAKATNRGDYESPLNVILATGPTAPAAGICHITGFNGIDMTIKIEAKANVTYRYSGVDRILTTLDTTSPSSLPALRADLLTFVGKNRKPMVPAKVTSLLRPFQADFQYSITTDLVAGSRLWWNEAFA